MWPVGMGDEDKCNQYGAVYGEIMAMLYNTTCYDCSDAADTSAPGCEGWSFSGTTCTLYRKYFERDFSPTLAGADRCLRGRVNDSTNYCTPDGSGKCSNVNVCDACCQSYIVNSDMCRKCVMSNPGCDTKDNMCSPAAGCNAGATCSACCQPYLRKDQCDGCIADKCSPHTGS